MFVCDVYLVCDVSVLFEGETLLCGCFVADASLLSALFLSFLGSYNISAFILVRCILLNLLWWGFLILYGVVFLRFVQHVHSIVLSTCSLCS